MAAVDAVDRAPLDAEGGGAAQIQALERQVALLTDKLANAEDEFAAFYSRTLKGEKDVKDRAGRQQKALNQLQKKIVAQAEEKRQIQRKLDDKTAPFAAELSEKEAAWAVERDGLAAQLRVLEDEKKRECESLAIQVRTAEDEKNQVLMELTQSQSRLQQLETKIVDMNANMQELEKSAAQWKLAAHNMNTNIQELEKSAAQWKLAAEKRKAQAVDAVAAQRVSDSRLGELEADLQRQREDARELRLQLESPVRAASVLKSAIPRADVLTQTDGPEVRVVEKEVLVEKVVEKVVYHDEMTLEKRQLQREKENLETELGSIRAERAQEQIGQQTKATLDRESGRRETEKLATIVHTLVNATSAAAQALQDARDINEWFQTLHSPPPPPPLVRTVDVGVGTTPPAVRHVGVGMYVLPRISHAWMQTERELRPVTTAAAVQTTADLRTARFHVDCQTEPDTRGKRVHAQVQTEQAAPVERVLTARSERVTADAATTTSPGPDVPPLEPEQDHTIVLHPNMPYTLRRKATGSLSTQTPKQEGEDEQSSSTRPIASDEVPGPPTPDDLVASVIKGAGNKRRSPLKASNGSADTGEQQAIPDEAVMLAAPDSDSIRLSQPSLGENGHMTWPASPNTSGGTPHPVPRFRRHFAGSSPSVPSLIASMIPGTNVQEQQRLMLTKQLSTISSGPDTARVSFSGKRPRFRASEAPLHVRLPVSPAQGSPPKKVSPISVLQEQIESEEAKAASHCDQTAPLQRRWTRAIVSEPVLQAKSEDIETDGEPGKVSALEALGGQVITQAASWLLQNSSGSGTSPHAIGTAKSCGSTLNWSRSDGEEDEEDNKSPHMGMVELDQARAQANIAMAHNVESALLSGRTGRTATATTPKPSAFDITEALASGPFPKPATPASAIDQDTLSQNQPANAVVDQIPRAVHSASANYGTSSQAERDVSDVISRPVQAVESMIRNVPNVQPLPEHSIRLIDEAGPETIVLPDPIVVPEQGQVGETSPLFGVSSDGIATAHVSATHDKSTSAAESKMKWLLTSPRDAASLLDESPSASLRIPGQKAKNRLDSKLLARSPLASADTASGRFSRDFASSDSSDDETWNGLVERGLRPRMDKSHIDEAAGLSKTLTQALADSVSLRGHITHDRKASSIDPRGDEKKKRVQWSHGSLDLDTHDLNGLLDEVRRAADRVERRKREALLPDRNGFASRTDRKNESNTPRTPEGTLKWSKRKNARDRAPERRKNVLNHRNKELSQLRLSTDARSGPQTIVSPGSFQRHEVLKTVLQTVNADNHSTASWSPIKPSQMAVLRSFLSKLDDTSA